MRTSPRFSLSGFFTSWVKNFRIPPYHSLADHGATHGHNS
ncbi:hypothetical protein Rahaq2_1473 [Rahnella aquatilis CIP 78.65 = ATCC 33071]|uniref:Uncharacterized protein n=1 Tax=Rahnella aquatilis (strain ATCC 33071 / DSM 4594 / JCM 1683 / NBRC 105701 / NCIMB 13365 / CIP 78.65) TaxID=745277 RepID=H2IQQ1_RAHAC|nr:hypothetical protein Rahaq2_1473 [Rahnella aquatilis CIP 78.65 = ATCC 33071]